MRTAEIPVTARHIACGVPKNCLRCPIALAILDAVPDIPEFEVNENHVHYFIPDTSEFLTVPLDASAQEFIVTFDDGVEVEPFTFTLEVPEAVTG